MSTSQDSGVLYLLQPDLLTENQLTDIIQSRCKIKNLGSMTKEGLVSLFRRVILPLPQRSYRTNRRGKMLSSRRAKAAAELPREEEGGIRVETSISDRLKPPPDVSSPRKIRLSSEAKCEKDNGPDRAEVNKKRKQGRGEEREKESRKRLSPNERPSSPSESKRAKKEPIRWP